MNTYQIQAQQGTKAGMKDDAGKARWDLVDFSCLDQMVDVLTDGAAKYDENNWQKVENPEARYFAALMRHLSAWRQGEKIDADDGRRHMAHVMANAMFLLYFDAKEKNNG